MDRLAPLLYGPMLGGLVVSTWLYGITCGQLLLYYRTFPHDSLSLKAWVATAFLLDTCQQVFVIHWNWWYLISRCNGNPSGYLYNAWSGYLQVIPSELLVVIVQCFYLRQLWKLGRRKITVVLLASALIAFAFEMGYCAEGGIHPLLSANDPGSPVYWKFAMWVGVSSFSTVVTDVGIAASMIHRLHTSSKQVLPNSRSVVQRIIHYFIASGCILSVAAVTLSVCFFVVPRTGIFATVYEVSGKLYINSLLAVLNHRKALQAMLGESVDIV
ncbi:hypothetical protein OE88DRAFT_1550532 [Heliocybe sulcata]|uniref:DUF6534 domain-containing protein n=1 Tax=Heliocybe sulcata TaxID=5364 RepID=A0A5C3N354_9AGAM|nr:hypothetical protein OE88DRAFT_1550532 [Heliocybe sulcata]